MWDGGLSLQFKNLDEKVKANHFPGIQEMGSKKKLFRVRLSSMVRGTGVCDIFFLRTLLGCERSTDLLGGASWKTLSSSPPRRTS